MFFQTNYPLITLFCRHKRDGLDGTGFSKICFTSERWNSFRLSTISDTVFIYSFIQYSFILLFISIYFLFLSSCVCWHFLSILNIYFDQMTFWRDYILIYPNLVSTFFSGIVVFLMRRFGMMTMYRSPWTWFTM